MADEALDPLQPRTTETRAQREAAWALPGTLRAEEIDRQDAQQGVGADFVDGVEMTAAAGAERVVNDEAPLLYKEATGQEFGYGVTNVGSRLKSYALSLTGFRAGEKDYDKGEKFEELTKGIPYEFHDDIMENDNYAAAGRARARIMEDMDRGKRVSQQDSGQLAVLAGSLFDVDMPMMAFSGGAYGAAKVARAALRASIKMNLTGKAALRLSGAAQGANAGLQAGVLVGAVDAHLRETTGWQDMANMAIQSMLLGTGIGTAVKGDVRLSVQAMQEEFLQRIARDDPAFNEQLNVNDMQGDNLMDYIPNEEAQSQSLSAARVTVPPSKPAPVEGATPTNQTWIDTFKAWRRDSGWGDRKTADDDTFWGKVAQHPITNMTTNNFTRLYKSGSAGANYLAGNIFESASGLGRGRATASTRMENYHKRIQTYLGDEIRSAQNEWAKANEATWQGSGYHISEQGKAVFNREVMLELNDRRIGRTSTRNPEIKRAADQYEIAGNEALGILRGRDGETPVDGFENVPDSRGYTPYLWKGSKIAQLEKDGVVTRADLERGLAQSYRDAGMAAGKDADAVSKAVIHRALSKNNDTDMSAMSMFSGDGKDFMRESMILGGMKEADADAVIARLTGAQHNRSKEGFAKTRNDVDMNARISTTDGSDLRVVDLLDNDLHGVWQRYTRQASGSAALARHGITNRAKRTEVIDAIHAEQRALGEEPMDRELLQAMFSHFNAGPVHGYGWTGEANKGIGHAALVKRITNLALLEKLGITQMAETGVDIAQQGLSNWVQRGPMALLNKEIRAGNTQVLDDLAFFTGEIGKDHWHFAPWLDLDDTTRSERGDWMHGVNKITSLGSFAQGYTSAFNHVRSFQQRTTALGITDKVFREIKTAYDAGRDLDTATAGRFWNDLGLDAQDIDALTQLVHNGTVEFSTQGKRTFVNRLNTDKWDPELGDLFASSITRNMNQIVQKSLAGEQDAWMHTVAGSVLMHLKTFPLQAIQKQVMRNAKFMDKQAIATVLYGMATAAVAVQLRDVIDGREQRSAKDLAKGAFNYSNMTGFIPTLVDPMMSLIGMDDARINQYGPFYDITPPSLRVANSMMRIPGAVANTVAGDANWYDKQALKAIPFAGTMVLSRAFD